MRDEIIVDSFAGGGGASLGISWALGRHPDIAINHDEAAIVMHARNHPETQHFTEDVWKVDPKAATKGRAVGLLWASPDCKHFSRAKGGKPVEKKIRSLAWVVCRWAAEVRPRVIMLENVREFADWGPLTEGMRPDPSRKGHTFRRFVGRLKALGYSVEWNVLNAADFGAPTHRRRLFLIARCDGAPIVWPEPTHGDPKKTAKADLFTGGKSLKPWRTAAECIDFNLPCPSIFSRKKPLAEKTMARIAAGIKRYVLDNPEPFIIPLTHHGERRLHPINEPLPTITAAHRGELAYVAPILSQYHGQQGIESRCYPPDAPINVIDTQNRYGLVTAFLAKHFGGAVGQDMRGPIGTITAIDHHSLVAANLVHLNHGGKQDSGLNEPMRTVVAGGGHAALVYSFLIKYFGTGIGQVLNDPLHTVTVKDRFGLVIVYVKGQPHVIVDIGLRMLTPRELARGQGFPDSYILTGTATSQVARIGNSVSPYPAKALVEANFAAELCKV